VTKSKIIEIKLGLKISTVLREISSILLFLIMASCALKSKNSSDKKPTPFKFSTELNFEDFIVTKGKLGDIKVGMKISTIQNLLSKFEERELEAYDFGFDGGGIAKMYFYQKEPIFALVPAYETDLIIAIVGLHENLIFKSKVRIGMTVKKVLNHYPNGIIEKNLMMGWEEIYDLENDFILVFKTDENNQIGKYKDFDTPSKPINLKPKLTWITIL
jgi:hypothetical protein